MRESYFVFAVLIYYTYIADMKHLSYFLSVIAALSLLASCAEKNSPTTLPENPEEENPDTGGTDPEPEVPPTSDVILDEPFKTGQGAFTIEDADVPEGVTVWTFDKSYGMKATAYSNEVRHETDSRLVSPELNLTAYKTAYLAFDHALNYLSGAEITDFISLQVTVDDGNKWQDVAIPGLPAGNSWAFVNSGDIDLSAFCGKKIKIAFRYRSTSSVAPTWKLKNVRVTRLSSDMGNMYSEVPVWLELPEVTDEKSFHIHTALCDDEVYRNYSFLYDSGHYVARWVAYPLCGFYTEKNAERSKDWYQDPFVEDQAILAKSGDFYANGYERGHQIPSADRLRTSQLNNQTFYYTNATPQLAEFNEGLWVSLETKVRKWSDKSDTLYVVTGCVLGENPKTVEDNVGKKESIPDAYFKSVLRYDASSSVNGGFAAFSVYLEHKENTPSFGRGIAISVDELEEKIGLDLFVNLAGKIGEEKADAVEAQSPEDVTFWWNN